MQLDYRKCAEEILDTIGGKENVVNAAHCATRLRLVPVDIEKIDLKKLEEIEGVKGVFENSGLLQIILGTGTVNKVYDEFLTISGLEGATKEEVKAQAAAKQPIPIRMLKALGDIFIPILPAIVAAGLMMGLIEAIGNFYLPFKETDLYQWMDLVANTAIVYLPVLAAVSAARVFGGNIYLGGTIGLLLMNRSLMSAWTAAGLEASEVPVWHILGLTIRQVDYQGHILPVIITIWVMCQIEKFLHKHVPEMLDLFIVPLLTVFATAFIAMTLIGPALAVAENDIVHLTEQLLELPAGIGAFLCGALYPLTVVLGVHHMFNALEAEMIAELHKNIWIPVSCSANFAMCTSCLAVFVKTRNAKRRSLALPASLSAALGITEPALFGINLRFVTPLWCGMIGAAFGAAAGTLMGVYGTSYGVTGIPGFLITTHCTLQYTLMLLIAGGIAFTLTLILWKEKEEQGESGEKAETSYEVCSPLKGKLIPVSEIPDETFASGVLGRTVAIEPEDKTIRAPFSGTVSYVADTGHAIGLKGPGGMELLIHVGIDTVNLEGKPFHILVKKGDEVKKGQKLLTFDCDMIREAGYSAVTPVILINEQQFGEIILNKDPEAQKQAGGNRAGRGLSVRAGERLMTVKLKK